MGENAAWRYGFGLGFLTAGLLALGAWEIATSSGLWLAVAIASVVCVSLGVLMKLAEHA